MLSAAAAESMPPTIKRWQGPEGDLTILHLSNPASDRPNRPRTLVPARHERSARPINPLHATTSLSDNLKACFYWTVRVPGPLAGGRPAGRQDADRCIDRRDPASGEVQRAGPCGREGVSKVAADGSVARTGAIDGGLGGIKVVEAKLCLDGIDAVVVHWPCRRLTDVDDGSAGRAERGTVRISANTDENRHASGDVVAS